MINSCLTCLLYCIFKWLKEQGLYMNKPEFPGPEDVLFQISMHSLKVFCYINWIILELPRNQTKRTITWNKETQMTRQHDHERL